MRMAIIDDSSSETYNLTCLCKSWIKEHHIEITIDCFDNGTDFLNSFKRNKYNIVFMDIYMKNLDGIQTAQELRKIDLNCILIFLTSSSEHMADAFSCHAFDYVTKPIVSSRLYKTLNDASQILFDNIHYLEISIDRIKRKIYYFDIVSVLSDNHNIVITLSDNTKLKSHLSFSNLAKQLGENERFLICNRGILINMDYVSSLEGNCFIMKNGERMPIKQRSKKDLSETFINYQFRKRHNLMGR